MLTIYMLTLGIEKPIIAILVGMVFVISILEGIAGPVRSTLVPLMVSETSLLQANSILAGIVQSCSLAGWAFGSFMVSWMGTSQVLLLSTLLLSGAWLSSISSKEIKIMDYHTQTSSWRHSIQEGWHTYITIPKLRLLLWMDVWEGLCRGAFAGALLLVFLGERLHLGEVWWGWMNGASLSGFVLISICMSRLSSKRWNLGSMLAVGSGCIAALTLGFSVSTSPPTILFILFAIGAFEAIKDLAERTLYQTNVPASKLAPLFAAQSSLASLLYGVSLVLSGWLADKIGIKMLYIMASVGFAMSFLGALVYQKKSWQRNSDQDTKERVG